MIKNSLLIIRNQYRKEQELYSHITGRVFEEGTGSFSISFFLNRIAAIVKSLPIYPHWLEFRNRYRGEHELYSYISGDVIETGAGSAKIKQLLLKRYPKRIKSYVATDYSSWDTVFNQFNSNSGRFGKFTQVLYGPPKAEVTIDKVADALNLPFPKNSFTTYCSFETLEHIQYPEKFFSEAARVVKSGGRVIISVPFLYREHGDDSGMDYFRFTRFELAHLAERNGLQVKKIFSYSFFGTTMATLTNQFIIRKFVEGKVIIKILLIIPMPFIFLLSNIIGYFIDTIDHDERFATRWNIVLEKSVKNKK